jgi:hypothetical protein
MVSTMFTWDPALAAGLIGIGTPCNTLKIISINSK